MNQIFTVGVAFTLLIIQLSCSGSGGARVRVESTEQDQPPPVIELELDRKLRLNDRLVFKWKVLNRASKPIFVFSSLLEPANAAFAEIELNPEQKVIKIGFVRSHLSSGLPPYSFPTIQFKQLNPGESLEGTFKSDQTISKMEIYGLKGDKLQKMNIGPGAWSLLSAVAWNTEINSVQRALQASAEEGQEHPVNAVTKWQKVATSAPVVITLDE